MAISFMKKKSFRAAISKEASALNDPKVSAFVIIIFVKDNNIYF